ncbi:enoyl-CoA hydratase/isomerase family protein [Nakamurella antarctica]|uniref:3-hydroxyisobutyryl-CoA hydrolase n=1 Tax=Nakamurella antarctica TaxID=1902245 RepID=A0A3G8ZRQ7_9ACTN|nr:enoyl-CoA hydratase/isomerase family protein [Nakamurella antarctica]
MNDAAGEVIVRVDGTVGRITLNRPRAINALNYSMSVTIAAALQEWADDNSVTAVVLDGAGEGGLCAGGDIRAVYADATAGGGETIAFWREEYRLNAAIAHYPKPCVAIMDGLVLGGGVGLSAHASHRVVTERSIVGMPEVGIGLIPDVGGTYLLSRSPGWTGMYAALTGDRVDGADAIYLGLADVLVESSNVQNLISAVGSHCADQALRDYAVKPPASRLAGGREWIDRCFESDCATEILANLDREVTGGSGSAKMAASAADAIRAASPSAVKVTLRAVRQARSLSTLEAALNVEFAVVSAALRSHDLREGIRAQVIDKDRSPQWRPAALSDVSAADVDGYFASVLDLPFPTS